MKSLAVVVVAYKINQDIIDRFFKYNQHLDNVYLVSNKRDERAKKNILCPEQEIFSIARCANLGIKQAIKDGIDIILKTDIDCIITESIIKHCLEMPLRMAACWRYFQVKDPDNLDDCWQDERCIGSAAMHAQCWEEIYGYNENMVGYGFDDGDLRFRARGKGITMPTLIRPHLYHIWHEDKHNRQSINPLKRAQNIAARKKYVFPEWGTWADVSAINLEK